ncbi:MAG: DUF2148 domain-containing protein [Caldiserica bacterium]|jgi:uncharacterized ferredoxin-like protein|nr:DUF2148 domain-containing protein [Caldisericota bacterium]MDH7562847.1 DUF2148 domain-containing protein [Caldisericota bacterium]
MEEMKREELLKKAFELGPPLAAARAITSPKGKGRDSVQVILLEEKEEIESLLKKVEELGEREEDPRPIFLRDAQTIRKNNCLILLFYSENEPLGLNCGFCTKNCDAATKKEVFCAFSLLDLGISLGSAVSLLSQMGFDNRIQYTLGKAAVDLGIVPKNSACLGVPVSLSSKNPFFDRFWW